MRENRPRWLDHVQQRPMKEPTKSDRIVDSGATKLTRSRPKNEMDEVKKDMIVTSLVKEKTFKRAE